ncbi:aspartic peptidase A1 [Melampsora americana]|nr:aspartic peptidase A1 [Melampsora americana]
MCHTKFGWQIYLASCALVSQGIQAASKVSIPVTNAIHLFTLPLGVGNPPGVHHVGLDTGSHAAYVGAIKPYVKTKTTVDLQVALRVDYAHGYVDGNYLNDTITFQSENGSGRIEMQTIIGNVSKLVGFDGFDGLIGLNIAPKNEPAYFMNTPLTVFMWQRGLLEKNMFGLSTKPTRSMKPEKNGMITFGGIDTSLFIGQISWYKCNTGSWWDWTATISYGKTALSAGPIQGIFDTGFTLGPALSTDLFNKYVAAIPGAVWDNDDYHKNNPGGYVNRHLLKIPKDSISKMQDLCFTASDKRPWCFTPEAQLIPEGVLSDKTYRYSYITPSNGSDPKVSTFNFGMKGHERYYVVYDAENYRVGLAETAWTKNKF